ncbi:hypothetical protein [Sphingopyxis macrogoltabida]|uniref:hypothetical protein n=1 Tax=Sphingopyxis macrogoltabida TaxID=33050 RepID=UPI0012E1F155|nr:hypothetical protein [Sphingopyxis macrogoltabida]
MGDESKPVGSFAHILGVKPPNRPMMSERFGPVSPFFQSIFQKAIRESDFYRDSDTIGMGSEIIGWNRSEIIGKTHRNHRLSTEIIGCWRRVISALAEPEGDARLCPPLASSIHTNRLRDHRSCVEPGVLLAEKGSEIIGEVVGLVDNYCSKLPTPLKGVFDLTRNGGHGDRTNNGCAGGRSPQR